MISNEEIYAAHSSKAVLKAHSAHEAAVNAHEAARSAVTKAVADRKRAHEHYVHLQGEFNRGSMGSTQSELARAVPVVEAARNAVAVADAKIADAHADLAAKADAVRVAHRAAKDASTASLAPLAARGIAGRIAAASRYDAAMAEARAAEAAYAAATAAVSRAQIEGYELPASADLHASLAPAPSPALRKVAELHRAERCNPPPASLEAAERAMWQRPAGA